MSPSWVFICVCLAVLFWGIWTYNRLIKNRQYVQEGWSGIDVQLKRRVNLIPNLISVVKSYAKHEKSLLEEVTRLRAACEEADQTDVQRRGDMEGKLTKRLHDLMVVVENYPDLKADQNFLDLQKTLVEIEDEIQMARRYYNGTVRNLNIVVETFPNNLVAKAFKFETAQFFQLDNPAHRQLPEIDG